MANGGLKAAVTTVLRAAWQPCRVHLARNALAHAGKAQRRIVSAWIGSADAQEDAAAAHAQWRTVADQLRAKVPKLAKLMDAAEQDGLACMHGPAAHRTKRHSTQPIARLAGEIKRRTDVVGILPNAAAVAHLVGGILLELSDASATPALPLHDPGSHWRRQRSCHRQALGRARLTRQPNPPRIIARLHQAIGHDLVPRSML